MAGPNVYHVRPPFVAGRFYPGDPVACRAQAKAYVGVATDPAIGRSSAVGAIVPHAGWICSGAIAGEAIAAARAAAPDVDVVVVFGAIHTPVRVEYAALDMDHDAWGLPGDAVEVAEGVAARLVEHAGHFAADERLHRHEHAVEVELPLVREAWPAARLLAVETPANDRAVAIGLRVAQACEAEKLSAVFLASSDLTHYGPDYEFAPAGVGEAALEWAKENDRRLLRIVTEMRAEAVVPEARAHFNACGAGAIAAMLAATRHFGARSASVLRHANSYETLARVLPQREADNAVGYAAAIVR